MPGEKVTTKPEVYGLDYLIGVYAGSSGRVSVQTLGTQLTMSGPVADEFAAVRTAINGGVLAATSWAYLSGFTGVANATAADVPPSDEGTHQDATATGYDGATVPNSARFSYVAAWDRWVYVGPYGAVASDVILTASGAENAITATSDRDYPAAAFAAEFVMEVGATNTGPVTVAINGGLPRDLVTSTGGALEAGNLTVGQIVEFRWDGAQYRLMPGITTASAVQRAEDAATSAEEDAAAAAASAALADSEGNATAAQLARQGAETALGGAEDAEESAATSAAMALAARNAAIDAAQYDHFVDDAAARTSLSPSTGERAFQRDNEHVYEWNGSSWDDLGPTPFATKASSADAVLTGTTSAENVTVSGTLTVGGAELALASTVAAHEARSDNPHAVTKAQVGLAHVDNTPDADKPVSTAQRAALRDLELLMERTSAPAFITRNFTATLGEGEIILDIETAAASGTFYWVVLEAGEAEPIRAEIEAGTGALGSLPIAAGSVAVGGIDTAFSAPVLLPSSATFQVWAVQKDGNDYYSARHSASVSTDVN